MKRYKLAALLLLTFLLVSCGAENKMPSVVLGEFLASAEPPQGRVYTTEVCEDDRIFLSSELSLMFFGHCEEEMKGVEACGIYQSAVSERCEAVVFLCYSRSGTDRIAALCLSRGELLGRYNADIKSEVAVIGRYVLFVAGEGSENMMDILKRSVR